MSSVLALNGQYRWGLLLCLKMTLLSNQTSVLQNLLEYISYHISLSLEHLKYSFVKYSTCKKHSSLSVSTSCYISWKLWFSENQSCIKRLPHEYDLHSVPLDYHIPRVPHEYHLPHGRVQLSCGDKILQ